MQPNSLNTDRLTARGNVRSPGGAPVRSARFAWCDPESGERLVVELRGSEAFLAALDACGFERLPETEPEARKDLDGGDAQDGGPSGPAPRTVPRLAIVTPLLRGSA